VLILFGEFQGTPDIVIIQRSMTLAQHPGQCAFPGGAIDASDKDAIAAALREAGEEIGLDISSVEIIGSLPRLWVPVSGFAVVPVVAWWRAPHEIKVVDPAEVERVVRISLADLTNPDNRVSVRHSSGYVGPAFLIDDLTIWGFTGGLLDNLLSALGFAVAWDASNIIELAQHDPIQDSSIDRS
jgi:8-oxo-dGTP pyrophosphatase MutT (NUDIX family)